MISRVADHCFWLNRYLERVETLARWLDVNAAFLLDVEVAPAEQWRPLLMVAGEDALFESEYGPAAMSDGAAVQDYFTWSGRTPGSIHATLSMARENARLIRETISLEIWEVINDLWLWIGSKQARRLYARDRHQFYTHLRDQVVLFHGQAWCTMLHEEPFAFMRLGTSLERADQTARSLDIRHYRFASGRSAHEMPRESAQWLAILRACSGIEPFFKRQGNLLSGEHVARFLLLDSTFPRSVRHNLERVWLFLRGIQPSLLSARHSGYRLVEETLEEMQEWDAAKVLRGGLRGTLNWVVDRAAKIGTAVHNDYFDPSFGRKAAAREREAVKESSPRDGGAAALAAREAGHERTGGALF